MQINYFFSQKKRFIFWFYLALAVHSFVLFCTLSPFPPTPPRPPKLEGVKGYLPLPLGFFFQVSGLVGQGLHVLIRK